MDEKNILRNLERFLSTHSLHLPIQPPLTVSKFSVGQSNPTYLISSQDNNTHLVLRKKPPGSLFSKTAHAIEREFRILKTLNDFNTGVPVPKVYYLCEDASVIGTPFYLMEYLRGRVLTDPYLPDITASSRREYYVSALQTLAKLHQLSYTSLNLDSFGTTTNFYQRQLSRLTQISRTQAMTIDPKTNAKIGDLPRLIDMTNWFQSHFPTNRTSIIHGDYKFDNLMFDNHKPDILGILDWELSTLGHPLSDLSNLLFHYYVPSLSPNPSFRNITLYKDGARKLQIPTIHECLKLYKTFLTPTHSDWEIEKDWSFGVAFALFKMAVILQGVAARNAKGNASSEQARVVSGFRSVLVETCLRIIDGELDVFGSNGTSKL